MTGDRRTMVRRPWRKVARAAESAARWSSAQVAWWLMSVSSAARILRRATLELVFPGSCLSCRAELPAGESPDADLPLCRLCLDQMELFAGPTCGRCGAPVPGVLANDDSEMSAAPRIDGCYRCRGRKLWFDETIAAGLYAGRLRELLLGMKRAEGDPLSLAVGQLVWRQCRERLVAARPDVVVPIPLHWRRRLAHRTNSAAILAEVLAGRLGVPLADGLLRRQRHTTPQFDLTPPQRWANVRKAFSVRVGYHLREAHVLLCDDILTTGATCSEAARTLRKAGAARVTVVVAARAVG